MVHVEHQPSAEDQAASEAGISRARSLFFNSIWLWSAGFLILLGAALAERSLALLGLLTLVTAGGAWLWARYALSHVAYTRTLD
ncbi:MAG: hypothetical protein M3439_12450, partial [Chloroflexota bacterium]|nr:hypothetical protein [Chloroflexota bacterium]